MSTETLPPDTAKRPLPPGWRWVRLGEVCEFLDSRRIPVNEEERKRRISGKKQSDLFPYYGANGQVGWIDDYLFDEPLILLAEDGGNFGSADKPIAYAVTGRYWVNNHAHVLRPRDGVIDFDYCLHSIAIRPDVGDLVAGSTRAKLNQEIAARIPIPLPPLSEQKRIAGILREQMAAVERARRAAEEQLQAAKALPAAYLREVFESEEAKGWQIRNVGDLCDQIDYGYTASADFSIKEPRFLRITDIQNGQVAWDKVPGCKITPEDEAANNLRDGDIVFARTGATTGKSFLIRQPPRSVFASYLIRLRAKPEVNAEFMYAFFQSDGYWQQIRASARGAGQPNVNAKLLAAMTMPLPPLATQRRIAAQISEQMASVERLRKALEEQLEAINKLPAALLRRAFSGEL